MLTGRTHTETTTITTTTITTINNFISSIFFDCAAGTTIIGLCLQF